MNYELSGKQ